MPLGKKFKVGLVGVAHPHVWGILRSLRESGMGSLVAASLDGPSSEFDRERLRSEHGLGKLYGDFREMLEKEDVDAVFNYADHSRRVPATELAASKGLHVMVEKPMAYSLRDADRMLEAAEKNGVKLMVNWPTMWSAPYRKAFELAESGGVGRIFHVRARVGHDSCEEDGFEGSCFQWMGQKEAGGAYLDFCCYGVALAARLMGMPKRVFGTAGNFVKSFIPSYDDGIVVMLYERGTAVVEGTWSQVGNVPEGPEIYGTRGTVLIGADEITVFAKEKRGGEAVGAGPLPPGERNAVEYFLARIEKDEPVGGMCDPKFSRDVQEVLEAGLISSERGEAVALPLKAVEKSP
ncbi:MAG: Gfo/Idh/MocA family oxidoreductase [Candidatus Brockarchaeota archaeon]|nr:Gfo/Idh/MocA family oxidoreductase [Candidatus Brockarchaeota archaeon]